MTCIVGLVCEGVVWIGADSLTTNPYGITAINTYPKLFRSGDFLIACTGSQRIGEIMQHVFEPPACETRNISQYMVRDFVATMQECMDKANAKEEFKESESAFLVGFKGRLFCVKCKYGVEEPTCGYEALGSGGEVALGVLWATRETPPMSRVELALEASAAHNAYVGKPFVIESI